MDVVYTYHNRPGTHFGHVKDNFIHRGVNPRLVLSEKVDGKYPFIQFETTPESMSEDEFYKGFYCLGSKAFGISFYIKNKNQ